MIARQILDALQARQAYVEAFIRSLVEIESPSGDVEGSRAVVDLLVQAASGLACVDAIERVDVPDVGQHLVIKAFHKPNQPQVLMVGHTDTVHSLGSLNERPWRREGGKIYGPGIFDMKANCALAIEVLRTLVELQATPAYGVSIVLTCDEEVGSLSGWPLIEKVAKEKPARCAFVMEPPASGGRVKTSRKGTGIFAFVLPGKPADGVKPADVEAVLKQQVRKAIGPIATPDRIQVVAGLPKTRSGKIMRRLLKDLASGQAPGDVTTLEDITVLAKLRGDEE